MEHNLSMQRILIVGSSCSGKTTLAARLARSMDIQHIELDALHWLPQWTERNKHEFKDLVSNAIQAETWIVDGNYNSRLGNLVWREADTVIWLNLSFFTVYSRLIKRCLKRVFTRQELWNGNKENLVGLLFERDSLLYWVPRHWDRLQKGYGGVFSKGLKGKNLLEFNSPDALECWLAEIER
jgi:adenylate kinase family enzyme